MAKINCHFDQSKVVSHHTNRHQDKKKITPPLLVQQTVAADGEDNKKLRKHWRNFRIWFTFVIIYDMENCYNNNSGWHLATTFAQCSDHHHHSPFLIPPQTLPHPWPLPIEEMAAEDRAASASKSHSQAEKRRRDRINAQLASLRKLIPKSDKMDKAALLGSVIEHVKELKRKAMDVSRAITVPTETDEVTIEYDPVLDESFITNNATKFKDRIVIKASVCCDDRPELFSELIQVLKGLRLTAVKADIASVGGRIKSIFLLCSKDTEEGSVCLSTLKHSLKSVVTKIASSSMASTCPTRSKRQRFFLPSHCIQ